MSTIRPMLPVHNVKDHNTAKQVRGIRHDMLGFRAVSGMRFQARPRTGVTSETIRLPEDFAIQIACILRVGRQTY
eukprot:4082995-Pyramimonas_sp.AAC.1